MRLGEVYVTDNAVSCSQNALRVVQHVVMTHRARKMDALMAMMIEQVEDRVYVLVSLDIFRLDRYRVTWSIYTGSQNKLTFFEAESFT